MGELFERTKNFNRLMNVDKLAESRVLVVGCGSIGSNIAVALARVGVKNFALVDMDTVEVKNVSSQAYLASQVGMVKVSALRFLLNTVMNDSGNIDVYNCRFEHIDTEWFGRYDIVINAVDSMSARSYVFDKFISSDTFMVDARVDGSDADLFLVSCNDYDSATKYRDTLYDDSVVGSSVCGGKFHAAVAPVVAGISLFYIGEHVTGNSVPFMWKLNMPAMNMTAIGKPERVAV